MVTGVKNMGRVTVEIEVANYRDLLRMQDGALAPEAVRRARIPGIVDTGAARLVLPKSTVDQLGLVPDSKVSVRYADQRKDIRDGVRNVWLKLCGREADFSAIVEPDRQDALIGAIVLEELDLIVDCTHQNVHPRDPDRIVSEIE